MKKLISVLVIGLIVLSLCTSVLASAKDYFLSFRGKKVIVLASTCFQERCIVGKLIEVGKNNIYILQYNNEMYPICFEYIDSIREIK